MIPPGFLNAAKKKAASSSNDLLLEAELKRLERAKNQGYGPDLYHGTQQDFEEFVPGYEDGLVFLTDKKEFANNWLGKGKLRGRQGQEAELEAAEKEYREARGKAMDYEHLNSITDQKEMSVEYDRRAAKFREANPVEPRQIGSAVYPVRSRVKNTFNPETDYPKIEPFLRKLHKGDPSLFDQGYHKQGNWLIYENPDVVAELKRMGYDSMRLAENIGGPHDTIAVFDPSMVRSKFAQFDPKKKDSTNILAGSAATAVGAGAALTASDPAQAGQQDQSMTPPSLIDALTQNALAQTPGKGTEEQRRRHRLRLDMAHPTKTLPPPPEISHQQKEAARMMEERSRVDNSPTGTVGHPDGSNAASFKYKSDPKSLTALDMALMGGSLLPGIGAPLGAAADYNYMQRNPDLQTPGNLALSAAANASPFTPALMGMFGGRLAKNADLGALARAEKMTAKGSTRESIMDETGWFVAPDGQWKFHYPDSDMQLTGKGLAGLMGDGPSEMPLKDAIRHDEWINNYDHTGQFDNTLLRFADMDEGVNGSFASGGQANDHVITISKNTPDPLKKVAHEGSHWNAAVAEEGWEQGGNPNMFAITPQMVKHSQRVVEDLTTGGEMVKMLRAEGITSLEEPGFEAALQRLSADMGLRYEDALQKVWDVQMADGASVALRSDDELEAIIGGNRALLEEVITESITGQQAFDEYLKLAGEAEARLNEAWMYTGRPPGVYPWSADGGYDVPEAQQKIMGRFYNEGPALSAKPKYGPKKQALIDQGWFHEIGGNSANTKSKKLVRPVHEMTSKSVPSNKKGPVAPHREMSPEEMMGGTLISVKADRSDIGKDLIEVQGTPLGEPVHLEGGHAFLRQENPDGAVFASGKGPVKQLTNSAERAMERGRDPFLTYMPGGHENMDFNTMVSDTKLELIKAGNIEPAAKKAFDEKVRSLRPEWVGLDDPLAREQMNKNGELRKAFNSVANMAQFKGHGFPDTPTIRKAILDPDLLDTPILQGGQSIARLDGRIIDNPAVPHNSYPAQMGGEYVGGFAGGIPKEVLFPDFIKGRRAEGSPVRGDVYAFERAKPSQDATQEWLDGIMAYIEGRGK